MAEQAVDGTNVRQGRRLQGGGHRGGSPRSTAAAAPTWKRISTTLGPLLPGLFFDFGPWDALSSACVDFGRAALDLLHQCIVKGAYTLFVEGGGERRQELKLLWLRQSQGRVQQLID